MLAVWLMRFLTFGPISDFAETLTKKHCPDNIPDSPASVYKTMGWISWEDWLGHPTSEIDVGEFTFVE